VFERFTQRARHVIVLAQEEAGRLDHNYIGTEHLLLGLLAEVDGVGARALGTLGISLPSVRAEIEKTIGRGPTPPAGHIPFTPRAKRVLELSLWKPVSWVINTSAPSISYWVSSARARAWRLRSSEGSV
jgi:ATP-dependent Clp protease ATP-binding subunit ClpC